mmetsp:Transcript_26782/g.69334  ORF Transcript_26782/g.69334 Transcript_26782/m.69334 type:complete len:484 (+) Transcript_26782:10-1461(+)
MFCCRRRADSHADIVAAGHPLINGTGLRQPADDTAGVDCPEHVANAEHLFVFSHGILGYGSDFANLAATVQELAAGSEPRVTTHLLRSNEHHTLDGVDSGGSRVANEILDVLADRGGRVTRLSLVGHSLGGLYMRYAAAVLPQVAESRSLDHLLADVKFDTFATFATPHLGALCQSRKLGGGKFMATVGPFLPGLSGMTAEQTLMVDDHQGHAVEPVGARLAATELLKRAKAQVLAGLKKDHESAVGRWSKHRASLIEGSASAPSCKDKTGPARRRSTPWKFWARGDVSDESTSSTSPRAPLEDCSKDVTKLPEAVPLLVQMATQPFLEAICRFEQVFLWSNYNADHAVSFESAGVQHKPVKDDGRLVPPDEMERHRTAKQLVTDAWWSEHTGTSDEIRARLFERARREFSPPHSWIIHSICDGLLESLPDCTQRFCVVSKSPLQLTAHCRIVGAFSRKRKLTPADSAYVAALKLLRLAGASE